MSVHNIDAAHADGPQRLVSAAWRLHEAIRTAGVQDATAAPAQLSETLSGPVEYLYDGNCSMCRGLVALLQRHDLKARILYVNIQDASYSAEAHAHIELAEALETLHVIAADGSVLLGTEALRTLFDIAGLGWAAQLSEQPIVAKLVDWLYDFLSSHRISLGNAFDAIVASKKMSLSKAGVQSCHDMDACEVEW